MTIKVSVVTPTFRAWNMLERQAQWLAKVDFPQDQFEWVIVDDLYEQRREWVASFKTAFPIHHMAPRFLNTQFDAVGAINTGFLHARGELLYLLVDYVEPSSSAIRRHWELYQEYGPKVVVMGPLYDALPNGEVRRYGERVWNRQLNPYLGEVTSDSYITRFAWFGVNDSVPLKCVLDVNGMDERMSGMRGGGDAELGIRLQRYGCRFLLDDLAPAFRHPKTATKPGIYPNPIWSDMVHVAQTGKTTWAPNSWSILEERKRLGRGTP